jgi:uncharacterized Zn finger protein
LSTSDVDILAKSLRRRWSSSGGAKADAYVGKFFRCIRIGTKITAKVVGNHGTYTVSIQALPDRTVRSACSCYIGRDGFCHHCAALAKTFLISPESFEEKSPRKPEEVKELGAVTEYLEGITLESLLIQLKGKGIAQKDFAAAIGMSTQHLSAIKSDELRNRFYHELGATKLACLWILEHHPEGGKEK